MKKILAHRNSYQFGISETFDGSFLLPIIDNLMDKAGGKWDDYDEVYHATRLIHQIQKDPKMHADFHFLEHENHRLGSLLVTTGNLDASLFFKDFVVPTKNTMILNSFHISRNGRGNGEYWLKNIVFPYYKAQGIKTALVKSSHSLAFPLYLRLGTEIGRYQSESDQKIYTREGKIFQITL